MECSRFCTLQGFFVAKSPNWHIKITTTQLQYNGRKKIKKIESIV